MCRKTLMLILLLLGIDFVTNAQTYVDVNVTLPSDLTCISSSININVDKTLIISPNPNKGSFTIEIDNSIISQSIEIRIANDLGRNVFSKKYEHPSSTKIQIVLPTIPKGFYLVTLESKHSKITKKLIVE
jgi:hypothetical protein